MLRIPHVRAFRADRDRLASFARPTALLLAVVAAASVIPAVAFGADEAAWCPETGPLRADAMPAVASPDDCALDGRVIEADGVAVAVPPRGERVGAELMRAGGGTALLEVTRRADGSVEISRGHEHGVEGAAAGGDTVTTAGTSDCTDDAYQLSEYRDTNAHTWYYKASTTPPGLSIGAVAQDFVDAFNAVTGSRNECGLADEMDGVQRYGGGTTRPSGIDHLGTCPANGDGHYVVDFGNLPDHVLARTCWRGTRTAQGWYEITEADVKIRKSAALFTGAVPAGCSGSRYSIKAIMTHEAGHTFGLRHVPERDHPDLTMSERTPPCSLAPTTLGLGDVKALRTAY